MSKQKNKVRIIGGHLGSRNITFTEVDGLRPTLERVRETLFNWLQAEVINASCLDLFAGSGALGFEALSRGAKEVHFIEKNRTVGQKLKSNQQLLKLSNATIEVTSALDFITKNSQPYDIIFVDPPFAMKGLENMAIKLENSHLIHDTSIVYLECSAKQDYLLPSNWCVLKEKKVGDVKFKLTQRQI